jgi:hypothetical protein
VSDYQLPPLIALFEHIGRSTRRCGIHGTDTTKGRCPECDLDLIALLVAQAPPLTDDQAALLRRLRCPTTQ